MDKRKQLQTLGQITLDKLSPAETQRAWAALLELCEQLLTEQEARRRRGKRGAGKGSGDPGAPSRGQGSGGATGTEPPAANAPGPRANHSSEAERRALEPQRVWGKQGKKDRLVVDVEVTLDDVADLPPDAEFERYEDYLVQDLVLLRWNTRFRRARFRSRCTGQSYLAPLPPGYVGHFGPGVRTLALSLAYAANVTQPLLHRFLNHAGCDISRGQVSALLTTRLAGFTAEAQSAIRAAVAACPWLQLDDTRSGVRSEHGCCHVLGNALATAYRTTDRGDRRSVIEALSLGAPLTYRLDEVAWAYLATTGVSQWVQQRLRVMGALAPEGEAAFARWLDLRFPTLAAEPREQILTAAALGGYHSRTDLPRVASLLTDDAAVLRAVIGEQALCWVHDARHYQKLPAVFAYQRAQYRRFRRRYWAFYRKLCAYRTQPNAARRTRLEQDFDRLVDEQKAAPFLAECIARTRKNKAKLLLVLEHPELPLHNNAAELAVRRRVRKRNVSFGPVSATGRQAWDTLQSLLGTVEKLGISYWSYLRDRIHGTNSIPPLAELIQLKAQSLGPHSWST